jgi:site-specific recombinase XerD
MNTLVKALPVELVSSGCQELSDLVVQFLRWFQFVRERSEHTIASYAFDLRTFVQFCERVGIDHPRKMRLQMIEAYLATLRHEKKLSVPTVNRHRSALNMFFRYLVREGVVTNNPVTEATTLKAPRRLVKRLTYREREHVLAALAQDDTPLGKRDLAIVGVGCLAGLRCTEIVTLRLDGVDLDTGRLSVIGKGDREREVPVVSRLRALLLRYLDVRPTLLGRPMGELYRRNDASVWRIRYPGPKGGYTSTNTHTYSREKALQQLRVEAPRVPDSPYLFVNASPRHGYAFRRGGQPLERRTIRAMICNKVSALVGRPVSPHQLRHTFASILTDRGANALIVQNLMGHSRLETTSVYVHLADETLRAEVEKCL